MRWSRTTILATGLVLAACDAGAPGAAQPEEAAPSPAAAPAPSPAVQGLSAIPATLHGRWGMVPADCEAGRSDAKGLLVIGPDRLQFYESVGTLERSAKKVPGGIRGTFAFTGEGMEWQRELALALDAGGQALVRTEFGPDAPPAPIRYQKCSQGNRG